MNDEILPHWKLEPNGSDKKLLIVFSDFLPTDPGPNKFAFRHILHDMPCNVLYIKDPGNQWYNKTIVGFADTIDSNVEAISSLIAERGFTSVYCFGASMGGYAALVYGPRLNAEKIVALSPQTFLAPPYPRFNPDNHEEPYFDLKDVKADYFKDCDTHIVASQDELFDVYSIARLRCLEAIKTTFIQKSSHLVARALVAVNALNSALESFYATGEFPVPESITSNFNPLSHRREVVRGVEHYFAKRRDKALVCFEKILDEQPDWAGCLLHKGRVLKTLKADETAAHCFRKALDNNPQLYEAASELAGYHKRHGQNLEAFLSFHQATNSNMSFKPHRDDQLEILLKQRIALPIAERDKAVDEKIQAVCDNDNFLEGDLLALYDEYKKVTQR